MDNITLEWAASVGGIAALVGLLGMLTKGWLKDKGDLWVNAATIGYSVLLNTLAFAATSRTTLADGYLLVAQIIVVASMATFGYEVVSNLRPKAAAPPQ